MIEQILGWYGAISAIGTVAFLGFGLMSRPIQCQSRLAYSSLAVRSALI
jgi:hypothetical protein